MTTISTFAPSLRIAALALLLAGPALAGAARADDAFGAYMQNRPAIAAAIPPQAASLDVAATALRQFPLGTAYNNELGGNLPLERRRHEDAVTPRFASTVPMAAGDVVGAHGPQDELARAIYSPGSNPAGW